MELSTTLEDQQRPKLKESNQEFQGTLRSIVFFLTDNNNTILIFSLQGTDLIDSKLFNYNGDISIESVVGVGWDGLEMTANLVVVPELYTLDPAYPNPFNPITNISYGLPVDGNVSINIYNIEGKIIETLHNGIQKAGNHSIQWDANVYPSGVYFVKFETQNFNKTQKLMLVK